MKAKRRKHPKSFWEGFVSTFDLLGVGFSKHENRPTAYNSWHRVGLYFTKGFERVGSKSTT